jgi:hypothetical protein
VSTPFCIEPDWKWGTAEGSRELDRLLDRSLTFREKLEWLEEAEALTLQLRASGEQARKQRDAAAIGPADQGKARSG